MDHLTNAELAILGLIVEMPRHGYEVERCIVERGMRNWTEIGFSSIYYILNKLEEAGWLNSRKENDENKPSRKVYTVTEAGLTVFRGAVQERLATPHPHRADFDLALANMVILDAEESRLALEDRRRALQTTLTDVLSKWKHDAKGGLPFHVAALFGHSVAIMQAELTWLDGFIAKINSERGEEKRRNDDRKN